MPQPKSAFTVRFNVFALCVLMLSSPGLGSAFASPQVEGDLPDGVGIYAEQADPCTPGSVVFDLFGMAVMGLAGRASALKDTLGGMVAEEVASNAISDYLQRGCNQGVAEIYASVAIAYSDAYLRAEQFPASPGYPDDVGIHHWADVLIQDFWGGTNQHGQVNGDGWGAIIWGGLETDALPQYVGGSFWVAYKNAVNGPNVVGTSLYPGYPINMQHVWPGSTITIQDFRGGSWSDAAIIGTDEEAWLVAGGHWTAYWQHNGQIDLRNPLGPLYIDSDGWYTQDFEGGRIRELGGEFKVELNDQAPAPQPVAEVPAELPPVGRQEPTAPPSSATCNQAANPVMTSRITASPGNPTTATEVALSVTITNDSCAPFAPGVMAIGGRDPAGNVTDPYQNTDFVLAPGESRTITQPVVLSAPGTHEFFMAYLRVNGGWHRIPDTSGDSSSMYVTVTDAAGDSAVPPPAATEAPPPGSASCSETGTLHASSRLSYSPENPTTATEGTLAVTLTNTSCGTFAPEVLAIGGRDPAGNVTDPLQSRDFVLAPGESRTITQSVVLTTPGTHEFFMAYLRVNGGWHRIPDANGDSASIYVTVSDAADVPSDNVEAPPAPTEVPPTTVVIDASEDATLTPTPVQEPEPQATDSGDSSAVIEPSSGSGAADTLPPSSSGTADTAPSSGSGAVDIALITRDPGDGHLLKDACYVLVNYSIEGCDENGDGQVTFAQIPPGNYTVRQTKTPAGYPTINEYEIKVQPLGNLPNGEVLPIPLGFVVKQAPEQNAPNTLNVSVILIDYTTGETFDDGICAELVGASNVGCDEDLIDGQIDFLDVPEGGPYELRFSNVPAGWRAGAGAEEPYQVWIMPSPDVPSIVFAFILFDQGVTADTVSNATNATLLMTFRACPEGFQPGVDDYAANCTIPLDAPDAAGLLDLRISGAMIPELDRQYDGTYVYTGSSPSATFILDGLAPVVRDGYTVVGHDSIDEDNRYWIDFPNGGTRHVYIYYYYTPGASQGSSQAPTESGSATLLMTFRGCPEGFDPNIDDFYANCTEPLDAPDASFLYHGGDGQGGLNIVWQDRQNDGAYIFNAGPQTMNVTLSGLAPVLRDGYQVFGYDSVNGDQYTVNLIDGETREVYVFYYYWP